MNCDEFAILVLKPDALSEPGRDAQVLALAGQYGLGIVCQHRLLVAPGVVEQAFPRASGAYVVERLLTEAQFLGREIELVLVEAPDAVARALALKSEARRHWERAPFANVIHPADHPPEWGHQLRVLAPECATCRRAADLVTAPHTPSWLPHVLAPEVRTSGELMALIGKLWDDPASPVWAEDAVEVLHLRPPVDATHELILLDNHPQANTDNILAAVMAAFPDADLETALRAVLAAVHVDEYRLAIGTEEDLEAPAAVLRQRAMGVIIQPSSDPWSDGR